LQVPAAQQVPADWIKVNSTKKANPFHPPEVLATLGRLALANEELKVACGQAWDAFLVEFAAYYVDFQAAVQSLAALDCLHSLALVAQNQVFIGTRVTFNFVWICQLIRKCVFECNLCWLLSIIEVLLITPFSKFLPISKCICNLCE
jgi:DNA mismatch repair ATPase MutS